MKITQAKDYKKPIYAIGIAAALAALAVTGCGDNSGKPVEYAGDLQPAIDPTEEVQLAGEATPGPDGTEKPYCKPGDDEVVLAGDVEIITETTEDVQLSGDVDIITETTDEVTLDGGVEFYEP